MEIAAEAGCSLHHAALHWLVRVGGVSRVLVGARTVEQLADNLSAFEAAVDTDTLSGLQNVSDMVHQNIPDIGNIFKYYP